MLQSQDGHIRSQHLLNTQSTEEKEARVVLIAHHKVSQPLDKGKALKRNWRIADLDATEAYTYKKRQICLHGYQWALPSGVVCTYHVHPRHKQHKLAHQI